MTHRQVRLLRWVGTHEVKLDHLGHVSNLTLWSLLHRKLVIMANGKLALTADGNGMLAEFSGSVPVQTKHAHELTERTKRLLDYARLRRTA